MKAALLVLILFSFSYALESLQIKKGWQIIGVPTTMDIPLDFNNNSVDIVWGYDAKTQNWLGFSPDSQKQESINQEYATLNTLQSFAAILILSKEDWILEYSITENTLEPENNKIELNVGWNLISIPQKIIISDKFFGDSLVWKYTGGSQWQVNRSELSFPSIESISLGEGVWVKSDTSKIIDINQQSSILDTFNTKESMLSYIRKMIRMNEYYGYNIMPILEGGIDINLTDTLESATAEPTDSNAKDASTTNLQESGVDEGDILKHDGTNIFSVDNQNQKIIVTTFSDIAQQNYTPINSIDFEGSYILSMYLQNSRLIVISRPNNYNAQEYLAQEPISNSTSNLSINIYNITDITDISLSATHSLDSNYINSRIVDNQLYLISSFYPSLTYNYNKIDKYNYDYANPIITKENLTPTITSDGTTSDLINPQRFYAPIKLDQRANITLISRFNALDGNYSETTAFLGNSSTEYVSTDSIYLVSNQYPNYYDFRHYKEEQIIYKFSLDENLSYMGRGSVEGRMLSQFSMSEYNKTLRVATTSGWSWWSGGETQNSIYTLTNTNRDLNITGSLLGLGKEGETIRAVRFMQERGYVVTFRQTDPLYTIDLSDPTNPKKIGELSIPGFSEYLHIVDENRVLSIGRNANESGQAQELQLQLFDVSDFSSPKLVDKIQIGNSYSYSEAEYNHKAFTYRASDLMFGVPYRNYSSNYSEHFGIYQINAMSIDSITTINSSNSNWGDVGRGLLFDLNSSTYGTLLKGSNIISKNIGATK